jgi:transposase
MIQLTPHMKIFVACDGIDFRCGIDALCNVVKLRLAADPFSGHVFVFSNRKRTAVKILVYDQQGFWLMMKRLSRGRFEHWPKSTDEALSQSFTHLELSVLLFNGKPKFIGVQPNWREYSSRQEGPPPPN